MHARTCRRIAINISKLYYTRNAACVLSGQDGRRDQVTRGWTPNGRICIMMCVVSYQYGLSTFLLHKRGWAVDAKRLHFAKHARGSKCIKQRLPFPQQYACTIEKYYRIINTQYIASHVNGPTSSPQKAQLSTAHCSAQRKTSSHFLSDLEFDRRCTTGHPVSTAGG